MSADRAVRVRDVERGRGLLGLAGVLAVVLLIVCALALACAGKGSWRAGGWQRSRCDVLAWWAGGVCGRVSGSLAWPSTGKQCRAGAKASCAQSQLRMGKGARHAQATHRSSPSPGWQARVPRRRTSDVTYSRDPAATAEVLGDTPLGSDAKSSDVSRLLELSAAGSQIPHLG
mmetsp:Transcript_65589/g.146351  ORF Transcript_65589/g.146351 Transcript_65589/m.146351 type:complete len:173 (-) Transcript_65589:214-732(-)